MFVSENLDDYYLEFFGFDKYVQIFICYVGGFIWYWVGICWCLMLEDMQLYMFYGVGCDWVFGYDVLELYYICVEYKLGICGLFDLVL